LQIALASLDSAWEDKPRSLARCRVLAERAAARATELLVFPEMTLTGFTMQATSVSEPAGDSPTVRAFAELARELGMAIAFGVVLDGRVRPGNRLVVVGPDAAQLASYAKLHPFSHAGEDRHFESGDRSAIVAVADVAFGLSICYDLRFPEVYSAVAERVSALLVIANWPSPRIAHWFALLQARAIECQCYAFGVNRTGQDPNGHGYPRSSCGFDPAGERLQPEWSEDVLDGFTIDVARVQEQRTRLGFLRDRRPETYRQLLAPAASG
jgi:predicted amidohydrolase